MDKQQQLDQLKHSFCNCKNCPLSQHRTNIVFGCGNSQAQVMFIGEAPGEQEDLQGLPFIGRAGKLLTNMITSIYLKREDTYICNIVKCRPPKNRVPEPEEIEICKSYLQQQIAIIQPKIICLLGKTAIRTILQTTMPLTALRGSIHSYGDCKVIATYHPAALLRNGGFKPLVWQDMKYLRLQLDGTKL
jgi:DNA polymerase